MNLVKARDANESSIPILIFPNSSNSELLSLYLFCLREPPYCMLFPVKVDSKICKGSMSSGIFIREQSARIICTCYSTSQDKGLCIPRHCLLNLPITANKLSAFAVNICFYEA